MSATLKQTPTVEQTKATSKKKPVQWRPSSLIDALHQSEDNKWVYRWCRNEEGNLKKKQAEGWSYVNKTEGDTIEHERPGNLTDGAQLSKSTVTYRDLVMMRMPKEMADARRDYYKEKTEQQIYGLKDKVNSSDNPDVFSGRITVGTRVIE